ncbi:hypothetical protein OpiT1DRAFT_03615 [Opitutaceae bacterium TAV1]|nr:hypothetical protein OpiT1DRAFT_03615 [Opitutaceae bacterium TAV1]
MQTSVATLSRSPLSAFVRRGRGLILGVALTAGLLAPAAGWSAADNAPRTSVKLLTIGNSFSNNAISQLPEIAKAGGKELLVGRTSLGGCSLERHAKHLAAALADPDSPEGRPYSNSPVFGEALAGKKTVSLPEALAAQKWDFVTIQEWSARSFKPEYQEPWAQQLIEAIRKYAPTAEILIHQTWAYREDHPWYQKGDELTQQKMYDGLLAAYRELSARYGGLRIIPSGAAIQAARQTPRWTFREDTSFDFKNATEGQLPDQTGSLNTGWRWSKQKDGKQKLTLDAIHANTAGCYLGGCAFYETIYNDSVLTVTGYTPKGVSAEDAAQLRQIAHDAVAAERARAAGAAGEATAASIH